MQRQLSIVRHAFCLALCSTLALGSVVASQQRIPMTGAQPVQARQSLAPLSMPGPSAASVSFLDSTPLTAQGPCTPNRAWPWTAQFGPGGNHLYVSLFGGFVGNGGCAVLRFDSQTMQPQGFLPVGESPEEIAFTTDSSGNLAHGFVTCSSASTVTVFNASHQTAATISIPFRPGSGFSTAFPFGLAVSPDQSTVWVGTGEGRVFAIDTSSLALDPSRTLDFGPDRGFGRITFNGTQLVLPTTRYHNNWQGSTASLVWLDPDVPSSIREVNLGTSPTAALYPSPQDVAIAPSGLMYVAGFDLGAYVFVVDPIAIRVVGLWETLTTTPSGKFQALGLHGNLLAVADTVSGEIARIDTHTGVVVGHVDVSAIGQAPNEITFSPGGDSLVIPFAGSDTIARFRVQ